jgi:hypothetical protein
MVRSAYEVVLKLNREKVPSSQMSYILPKNYLHINAPIKTYIIISNPKLVIGIIELARVSNNYFKASHFFTILKILIVRNAFNTFSFGLLPAVNASTKLINTIKASNTLNLSSVYFINPNPTILNIISNVNNTMNI